MIKSIKNSVVVFLFMVSSVINAQSDKETYQLLEVSGMGGAENYSFVEYQQLYTERWDTLAQLQFWRTVMNMPKDSAVINIGSTRQIIKKIDLNKWDELTEIQETIFRDSIKELYKLPPNEHVYVTSGKRYFYDFKKVIPSIGKGIDVFYKNNVDPFYAQAILLIESPNKIQKSSVGAYGSFQLMKRVAISLGLKVNKTIDERKDFDKSAWASAKLIRTTCIPHVNKMLEEKGITFQSTDLWYRMLVLHVYHAGATNVKLAIDKVNPVKGDMNLITQLWQTEAGNFRNSSQNYSQLALASLLELDKIIYNNCNFVYFCPLKQL